MNQTIFSEVGSPTPPIAPIASPPPIAEWGVVLAGLVWIAKQLVEQFRAKESAESDLMKGLITHQQSALADLMADAKTSRSELIQQIQLEKTVGSMVTLTSNEVQRAMGTQSSLYTQAIQELSAINQKLDSKLDAIHRRIDKIEGILMADSLEDRNREN